MSKVRFTKGELKRQRDALRQFEHFLPFLQLKKQQLQLEIQRAHEQLKLKVKEIDDLETEINEWAGLLNEGSEHIAKWIREGNVATVAANIAGVDIPVFERVDFEEPEYDLFLTPLWIDIAIDKIRMLVIFLEEEKIIKQQLRIMEHELRIATQRVNLFEKIKIPECKENTRLIRIYLGDQQTNAVGRSKIAKKKIEEMVEAWTTS
ncbi:MAG: V-type ATP synthase subunit D [Candidatus Omnitrophica bacterium]|nr:V-type ATP synthase subunit D [Candidatus Omnitrophota bacterium]